MSQTPEQEIVDAVEMQLRELADDLERDVQNIEGIAYRMAQSVGTFYRTLAESEVPLDLCANLTTMFMGRMLGVDESSDNSTIISVQHG